MENNSRGSLVSTTDRAADSGDGVNNQEGITDVGLWDPATVAALYARHSVELQAYLTGLLRNRDLAAEALQATFTKAIEHRAALEGRSPKAWLFRVAHNEAIDLRRRATIERRVLSRVAWWNSKESVTPDESADRDEIIVKVRQAIEQLPVEQRRVVESRIYEERTFAEIAERFHLPLGTVLTRMRLATKKLAEALQGERDR